MIKTLFLLAIISLSFSSHSEIIDDEKWIASRWFKTIPEAEALQTFGSASQRELPLSLKALVWNVKKGALPAWQNDFTSFAQDRDLIVVQEAFDQGVFVSTIQSFENYQWDMGMSFRYVAYNLAATGSMVGSWVLPQEVQVKHSVDLEPFTSTPKSITFARYDLAEKAEDLLVISVHAINFDTTGAFKRQMDQIEEAIQSHEGPVFLAGDFNTWNAPRTKYLFRMAKRLALSETDYLNSNQRMTFKGWPLDHIFSRGILIKKAEVVGESKGSDHKPFLVEMEIQ